MKTVSFFKEGQKLKQSKTTGISTEFFISHMYPAETDTYRKDILTETLYDFVYL